MSKPEAIKAFKKEPWHFNGSECASILGVAKSTFSQRGYPAAGVVGRDKFYDLRAVIRADILENVSETEDGEFIDHEAEKARWTKARRVAQEIENERLQGELRPVEEVEQAVIAALVPVAAALDSLPMAIKRDVPELSQGTIERIERAVATMRNALADDHIVEPRESSKGEDT